MRSRGSIAWLALALALATCAAACAPVPAWRRGRLAHPAMADAPDPEGAAFDGHLRGAREAALEPGGAGGAGCGCN